MWAYSLSPAAISRLQWKAESGDIKPSCFKAYFFKHHLTHMPNVHKTGQSGPGGLGPLQGLGNADP